MGYVIRDRKTDLVKAIAAAGGIVMKNCSIALVCDEYLSCEDYFCVQKFLDNTVSECFVVKKPKNELFHPNTKGVEWFLKDKSKVCEDLSDLNIDLQYKTLSTIISINVDIFAFGLEKLPMHTRLIYLGNDTNRTSAAASVVIHTPTISQKNGIYINYDFFEDMKFFRNFILMYQVEQTESLPKNSMLEREVLFMLLNFYREDLQFELPVREKILEDIKKICPELSRENLLDIKPSGVLLKKVKSLYFL